MTEPNNTFHIASIDIPFAKYAIRRRFLGEWQIESMSEWSSEFLAASGPPRLKLSSSGYGTIAFTAFEGILDAMTDELRPEDTMQFSFRGTDDGDEVCGRGFAVESDGVMRGRICFNRSVTSDFVARRLPKQPDPPTTKPRLRRGVARPPSPRKANQAL
jgi:hypothetical protein